tara:strand:+ start:555 stop:800 length:246 start_codon:yes stop_codon:yes gene_type:complete
MSEKKPNRFKRILIVLTIVGIVILSNKPELVNNIKSKLGFGSDEAAVSCCDSETACLDVNGECEDCDNDCNCPSCVVASDE